MVRTRLRLIAGVLSLVGLSAATSLAAGVRIDLPPEQGSFKPGPGADLARDQCLTCHSADYVSTQPPGKPLAFWKAEVEKMKKIYGAPIQDSQIDPIAAYLAQAYGSGKGP